MPENAATVCWSCAVTNTIEKHAVKPFSTSRILEALDAAIHRTEGERAAQLIKVLFEIIGQLVKCGAAI